MQPGGITLWFCLEVGILGLAKEGSSWAGAWKAHYEVGPREMILGSEFDKSFWSLAWGGQSGVGSGGIFFGIGSPKFILMFQSKRSTNCESTAMIFCMFLITLPWPKDFVLLFRAALNNKRRPTRVSKSELSFFEIQP